MNYGKVKKVNDDLKKDNYNIQDILKILPHRYPFVLIDRINEVKPGEYVNAIKNVTIMSHIFKDIFLDNQLCPESYHSNLLLRPRRF